MLPKNPASLPLPAAAGIADAASGLVCLLAVEARMMTSLWSVGLLKVVQLHVDLTSNPYCVMTISDVVV